MCGLVGAAGVLNDKHRAVFKKLLQLDTIRGPHSTGVATVRNKQVFIDKCLGTPWEFADTFKQRFTIGKPNHGCDVLIGHNRYATMGAISAENAHPFNIGNITGVHNGTLDSRSHQDMLDDGLQFDVDSECVIHNIDKNGIKDTYSKLAGAWSLVWWDEGTNKLNFIRNADRPMYIVRTVDRKTMFWASEKWMLDVACNAYGVDYIGQFVGDPEVEQTDLNVLYEFDVLGGKIKYKKHKAYKEVVLPKIHTTHNYEAYGEIIGNHLAKLNEIDNTITTANTNSATQFKAGDKIAFYLDDREEGKNVYNGWCATDYTPLQVNVLPDSRTEKYLDENTDKWFIGELFCTHIRDGQENYVVVPTSMYEGIDWYDFDMFENIGVDRFVSNMELKHIITKDTTPKKSQNSSASLTTSEEALLKLNKSKEEAQTFLDKGCGVCGGTECVSNISNVKWIPMTDQFVCSGCSKDKSLLDTIGLDYGMLI